jgi:dATP pyrophosphohydrolase
VSDPRPWKIPESVLVVVHTPDLQVLLLERTDMPGCWQSVTGAKDHPEESFRATAIREVAEETGIVVGVAGIRDAALVDWQLRNVYDIYPRYRHRYAPGVTRNVEQVFGLQVPVGTPVRVAPREHLAYQWLPVLEAADRCFSASNAEALLQLRQRVQPR